MLRELADLRLLLHQTQTALAAEMERANLLSEHGAARSMPSSAATVQNAILPLHNVRCFVLPRTHPVFLLS